MPAAKARYWILTIPVDDWNVPVDLPAGVTYLRGQQEIGEGGFHHWQLVANFKERLTLQQAKAFFVSTAHLEPSRSAAVDDYVWKEESRVPDTQFELGVRGRKRRGADYAKALEDARSGRISDIMERDPALYIRHHAAIHRIATEWCVPEALEKQVFVYWGDTGTGKTRTAYKEAQEVEKHPYWKDACTKWWDGYRGQRAVIIDEFGGLINILHLLRWLDRYPVQFETKGGSHAFCATHIWITSNVDPAHWWDEHPKVTQEQKAALRRRFTKVVHFHQPQNLSRHNQ